MGSGNHLLARFESYLDNNLRGNKDQQPLYEQNKFHSRKNSDVLFSDTQEKQKIGATTNFQSISRKSSNFSIASTLKQDEQNCYKSEGVKYEKQYQKEKSGLSSLFQTQQPIPLQNNYMSLVEQMQQNGQKKTLFSNQISRESSPSIYQSSNNAGLNAIQKKIEAIQQLSSSSQKSPFINDNTQESNPSSLINRHKRNSSVQIALSGYQNQQHEVTPQPDNKKYINLYQIQTQSQPQSQQQQQPQSIYQQQQNILQQQSQKKTTQQQQNTQKSIIQQQQAVNSYLPLNNADSLKSSIVGQQYQRFAKKASVDLKHVDLNAIMKQSIIQQQLNNLNTPITDTKTKQNYNQSQQTQPQSNYPQQKWNTVSIGSSSNYTKSSSNKENDESYQTSFNQQKKSNVDLSIFNTYRKDNEQQSNGKNGRSFLNTNSSNIDNLYVNFQASKQDTKVSCEELDDSIRNIICQKINFQQDAQGQENNQPKTTNYIDEYSELEILKPDSHRELPKQNGIENYYIQKQNSIEEQVVFNNSIEQNQQDNVDVSNSKDDINKNKELSDQDFSKVKISDEISSKQIKTLSNIFKICDTKNLPNEYIEQLIDLKKVISDIIAQNQ